MSPKPKTISDIITPEIDVRYDIDDVDNIFTWKDRGFGEIEVGKRQDKKTCLPHLRLKRWDGECNFVLAFQNVQFANVDVECEKERIQWKTPAIEIHLYDKTKTTKEQLDRYEFEVVLNIKPLNNIVEFDIESEGLKFYYQPPLTQEQIDGGAVQPDDVIGSYAVYHATQKGDYSKRGGHNYRAGKAFHIYRPKITDAIGKWAWCDLHVDEVAKKLVITIPQTFLDNAVFPVVLDPTFGCDPESPGAGSQSYLANWIAGTIHTAPAGIGTATSITAYGKDSGDAIKGVITLLDGLTIIDNGVGAAVDYDAGEAWKTSTFGTPPSLTEGVDYLLSVVFEAMSSIRWDFESSAGRYDSSNSFASPQDWGSASTSNYILSIYCTYEEGGAPEAPSLSPFEAFI